MKRSKMTAANSHAEIVMMMMEMAELSAGVVKHIGNFHSKLS